MCGLDLSDPGLGSVAGCLDRVMNLGGSMKYGELL